MSQPETDKERSRGVGRDMSPEAIARRLDIVSELRALSQFLGRAKRVEKEKSEGPRPTENYT